MRKLSLLYTKIECTNDYKKLISLSKDLILESIIDYFEPLVKALNKCLLLKKTLKAYEYLIDVYYFNAKYEETYKYCLNAIDLFPNCVRPYAILSLLYYNGSYVDRNYQLVEKYALIAIKNAKDNDDDVNVAYNNLGLVLLNKQKIDEAINCFLHVIDYSDDEALLGIATSNLSYCYIALEEFNKAVEYALKANPKTLLSNNNLAAAYIPLQKYKEAKTVLCSIIKEYQDKYLFNENYVEDEIYILDTNAYVHACYNMAWMYHQGLYFKKNDRTAFKFIDQAIERDNSGLIYYLKGEIFFDNDDYDSAIENYVKSIQYGYPLAYLSLGYLHDVIEEKQDIKKAKHYYQLAGQNGVANAYALLAYLYEDENDNVKAKKCFLKADKLGCDVSVDIDRINERLSIDSDNNATRNFAIEISKKNLSLTDIKIEVKKELIKDFDYTYSLLDEEIKNELFTGLLTYVVLFDQKDDNSIDYSNVTMPLQKALEVFLRKWFFDKYIDFLIENNYSPTIFDDFSSLIYTNKKGVKEYSKRSFTIGTFSELLHGVNPNKNKDKYCESFLSYCSTLFNEDRNATKSFLSSLSDQIESIRVMRNRSAHSECMSITDAEICSNWIIKVKKIIKTIIGKIQF